jgi:hypothetical protein
MFRFPEGMPNAAYVKKLHGSACRLMKCKTLPAGRD